MGRRNNDDEPTLAQAWAMVGGQLGMAVEERGERSIRAHGCGPRRAVVVDGEQARLGCFRFLFGSNTVSTRNRREAWHTVVAVACANPRAVTGVVESAVDVRIDVLPDEVRIHHHATAIPGRTTWPAASCTSTRAHLRRGSSERSSVPVDWSAL